MMNTPKVAVVILNWNGVKYLRDFLPYVLASTWPNLDIVVGDNASSDDSVAFLRANYPSVRIIENDDNYGFTGGYNRVLAQVRADYYILLNSDVEVQPNWIEPVIALMETDDRIAAAAPKIKAYHNQTHFEHAGAAGGFIDKYGYPFCRGRIFYDIEEDKGQYEQAGEVFWASGAAMFIKKHLWDLSGGFDETFFAHMEEIDLCWRLLNMQYRITYCGKSVVYHVGGGTLHKSNPRKTFLNYRNNLIMLFKNLPKGRRWKTVLIRLVLDGISSVRFMATGAWPDVIAIIRAHFAFYALIPSLTKNTKRTTYRAPLYYRSVVWEYFVLGKHRFNQLTGIKSATTPK